MTNRLPSAVILCLAALLAACGSRPVPQPAVLTASQSAMQLGMHAYENDDYSEARNFFTRALDNYRSVDDRTGELNVLLDLADSALGQGDYPAARMYLANAQPLADGSHASLKPRLSLLSAYADMQAGENQSAATALDTLLSAPATPADIRQATLFARTQVAFDLKSNDANEWLNKLAANLGKNPAALDQARYQRLQALALRSTGDEQKAAALYQNALAAYRVDYFRPGIAATLEEWAALSMQQQDWPGARDKLQRALNVRLSMYDREHSGKDLEKLSEADARLGNTAASKQELQLAAYLKNGGDPGQLPEQP